MWTIGGMWVVRKDTSEKDPRKEQTIHAQGSADAKATGKYRASYVQ